MGQTSVGRLHGRLDVLQTLLVAPPSWIQDGGAGNDVIQDLGRVFRSPLRSEEENGGPSASGRHLGWPHLWEPDMRSSKMATGSGRAAIFLLTPQWGSKNAPYTTTVSMRERKHGNCIDFICPNNARKTRPSYNDCYFGSQYECSSNTVSTTKHAFSDLRKIIPVKCIVHIKNSSCYSIHRVISIQQCYCDE